MKYLFSFLILGFLALQSQAQEDSTAKSSLTLAAVYGSTANYFGQTTAEKLPYLLSHASYNLKNGIYFSASALTLLNNGNGIAAVDLSGGYGFKIASNLEGGLSYTRSFYQKDAPLLQAANENNINGILSLTHFLKSSLSADYAFGSDTDLFVTLSNSKLLNLGSFSENDFISLEPAFSVIAGSQRFYQTYTTEKQRRKKILDPLFPGNQPEPETTTVESTSFDVLAYSLSVPLAYNRTNYTLEASYSATLGSKKLEGTSDKPVSIFNLSFYYMF